MQRLEQQQQQQEMRADEADAVNSNAGNGGIKRFIKRESPSLIEEPGQVRTNRAARLRAAAASATPPPDAGEQCECEPTSRVLIG